MLIRINMLQHRLKAIACAVLYVSTLKYTFRKLKLINNKWAKAQRRLTSKLAFSLGKMFYNKRTFSASAFGVGLARSQTEYQSDLTSLAFYAK